MNSRADFYFEKHKKFQTEIEELRSVVLECGLKEDLKWGVPCYTWENKNIVLIHVFKEYCALLFFKGSLMRDPHKLLIRQTKNVQAARQIRFKEVSQIRKKRAKLKAYVRHAVEVEKSGIKIQFKKSSQYDSPEEFQNKLNEDPALKNAFKALTPGRQRAYILHFSSAKQSKTRESRVEKNIKRIMAGKGLHD